MKTTLKSDSLDALSFLNGLVFFAPVSLLVRTMAGLNLSVFFVLQAILSFTILLSELPAGKFTDQFGYKNTIVLYEILLLFARCLLLLAFLDKNIVLFLLESIIEGIAVSFHSGTESAYVYAMFPENCYTTKIARIRNWSTMGFVLSTILYAVIYRFSGIEGLLISTILSNMMGVVTTLRLPKEPSFRDKGPTAKSQKINWKALFFHKRALLLVLAVSATSLGRILINFFYAEKLVMIKITAEWLTPIILGYSVIELLSERIICHISREKYLISVAILFTLSGVSMVAFGVINQIIPVIFLMLILPLLLNTPSCILSSVQNQLVDSWGKKEKRAEILSMFNMGINLLEVALLFGSSFISEMGSMLCFSTVGIGMVIVGWFMHLVFRTKTSNAL